MLWDVRHRQDAEFFRGLRESGQIVPDERVQAPSVNPRFLYVYDAFNRLETQRHFGETGPQYVRIESILAYADLFGIDDAEDREDFAFLLESMDRAYIAELAEKRERESKRRAKTPPKTPGRR